MAHHRERLDGQATALFESGARRRADIVKAVALGAGAALPGRPHKWGLTLGGEAGRRDVIQNLLAGLDLTLALSGHASFATVDRSTPARAA